MGFMKPNRSAAGDIAAVNAEDAQRRAASQAERDKSDLISSQLDEDTLLPLAASASVRWAKH
jgi:hypothetical protein